MTNQTINCTVGSCKYNNHQNHACTLSSIKVDATGTSNTCTKGETLCQSFEESNS